MLGLKKTYEHPVSTSFEVGGVSFALAVSGTKGKKNAEICKSCSLCVLRYTTGLMKPVKETPTATSVIYFEIENLDEFYNKLKEQGVTFVTEPKEQGWGVRTAVMLDPDKNVIVLSKR